LFIDKSSVLPIFSELLALVRSKQKKFLQLILKGKGDQEVQVDVMFTHFKLIPGAISEFDTKGIIQFPNSGQSVRFEGYFNWKHPTDSYFGYKTQDTSMITAQPKQPPTVEELATLL